MKSLYEKIAYRVSSKYPLSELPVILATTNKTKIEKFTEFLSLFEYRCGIKFHIDTLKSIGLESFDCPEPYYTYEENARLKNAMVFYYINEGKTQFQYPVSDYLIITDDTGLEISDLDGWPGVKTKRAAETIPHYTGMTSAEAILEKLSTLPDKLEKLHGALKSSCVVSLAYDRPVDGSEPSRIIPSDRMTFCGFGTQLVRFVEPEKDEKVFTAWDICSPSNADEISGLFHYNLPVYSKMPISKSMLYEDYMWQSFKKAMDSALDAYKDL